MSTCKQIVEDIQQALRHAPNVEAHREELIRRINKAMNRIATEKRWAWRQRLVSLQLREKIELTKANLTLDAAALGAFAIGFALPSGWSSGNAYEGPDLRGAKVTVAGSSSGHDGTYIIEHSLWDSGTSLVIVFLDQRWPGDSSGALAPNAATFTIEFDRYRLPGDFADLHSAVLRDDDRGPLREVTLDQEQSLLLDADHTPGIPECFLISPNRPRSNWNPRQDYLHVLAEPPHEAPTASAAGAAGAFVAGDYDYCWSWAAAGLISAPSPTVRVTVTANQTVTLANLPAYVDSAGDRYGWRKIVWRRRVYSTRNGPWYKVTLSSAPALQDLGSEVTTTTDLGGQRLETLTRMRDWPVGDSTRFIRFWPPTDADRVAEVRYLSVPRALESDTDEPEMPDYTHDLLVHAVVQDLAAGAEGAELRKHHERLYTELYKTMCRRELAHSAVAHQKGAAFAGDAGGLPYFRPGTAVWNG